MSEREITAIINLVLALLPILEKGALALIQDVRPLLDRAWASPDTPPELLDQIADLLRRLDAAENKAYQAYQTYITPGA